MSFAEFYVENRLRSWGWPRQKGLIHKITVVDAFTLDQALEEIIQVTMGIGAGRKRLALSLLTELSEDRSKAGVDDCIDELLRQAEQKIALFGEHRPWRSLMALRPPDSGRFVPIPELQPGAGALQWRDLNREPFISAIPTWYREGLAWGLHHHREVDECFEAARVAGLSASPPYEIPTSDTLYDWCDEWIRDYEKQVGPLPEYPGLDAVDTDHHGQQPSR